GNFAVGRNAPFARQSRTALGVEFDRSTAQRYLGIRPWRGVQQLRPLRYSQWKACVRLVGQRRSSIADEFGDAVRCALEVRLPIVAGSRVIELCRLSWDGRW